MIAAGVVARARQSGAAVAAVVAEIVVVRHVARVTDRGLGQLRLRDQRPGRPESPARSAMGTGRAALFNQPQRIGLEGRQTAVVDRLGRTAMRVRSGRGRG
jgi:hypothetical protein